MSSLSVSPQDPSWLYFTFLYVDSLRSPIEHKKHFYFSKHHATTGKYHKCCSFISSTMTLDGQEFKFPTKSDSNDAKWRHSCKTKFKSLKQNSINYDWIKKISIICSKREVCWSFSAKTPHSETQSPKWANIKKPLTDCG